MKPGTTRRARSASAAALVTTIVIAAFSACQSTPQTTGGQSCTYQEVIRCTTDAGCEGTQTCLPDLSAYGPCRCGGDAGIARDAAKDGA